MEQGVGQHVGRRASPHDGQLALLGLDQVAGFAGTVFSYKSYGHALPKIS
jgi:hypothetical protein